MSDWYGDKPKSTDDEIANSPFTELERAAEQSRELVEAVDLSCMDEEDLRNFAFIEELASPVRSAIFHMASPPTLPDYGPLVEVGRGGMGVVYCAENHKTNRIDAIKIIRPDRIALGSEETRLQMLDRFKLEGQLAACVSH